MSWAEFEQKLHELKPRFYVTHVTAPTLTIDMYGCFLAKTVGATTLAFGTHTTPLAVETMRPHPALDYVLRGEPDLTLREVVDTITRIAPNLATRSSTCIVRPIQNGRRKWLK